MCIVLVRGQIGLKIIEKESGGCFLVMQTVWQKLSKTPAARQRRLPSFRMSCRRKVLHKSSPPVLDAFFEFFLKWFLVLFWNPLCSFFCWKAVPCSVLLHRNAGTVTPKLWKMEVQERSSSKVGPSRVQRSKNDPFPPNNLPQFGTIFECFWGLIFRPFLEPPFFVFLRKQVPKMDPKWGPFLRRRT